MTIVRCVLWAALDKPHITQRPPYRYSYHKLSTSLAPMFLPFGSELRIEKKSATAGESMRYTEKGSICSPLGSTVRLGSHGMGSSLKMESIDEVGN